MSGLRAITVCVDYQDLLAVTLAYNRGHFSEFHIVTDGKCFDQVDAIARPLDCCVHMTQLFYERGAAFNKWAALEWGIDQIGREGWLCLMDADVLWPKMAKVRPYDGDILQKGYLCTPLRRMAPWPYRNDYGSLKATALNVSDGGSLFPVEEDWKQFPVHRNVREWAGYSQIFHASDPVLGPPPWHEIDWKHAGGADSIFQRKWPAERKVRPPWECLHLGEAGKNWFGRGADPRLTEEIWRKRREARLRGASEAEQFRPEKLS